MTYTKVLKHAVRVLLLAAVATTLSVGGLLYGQTQNGDIVGTVRDAQGRVIPDATVRVTNEATGAVRNLVTDSHGEYIGLGFLIGTYRVEAQKTGFQRAVITGIRVGPQEKKRVDLTLQIGKVVTTVQVTGAPPVIQSEGSSINTQLPKTMLEKPMENTSRAGWAYDPAAWLPGYSDGPNGLMLWGGSTGSQTELQVEGNQTHLEEEIAPQSVQELNIVTGTPPAEYGRPAIFDIELRSGSNTFHGSFHENLKNPAVDAVNTIAAVNPSPTGVSQWRHEFNFSGPVYIPKVYDGRDKTFFFIDYWRSPYGAGLSPVIASIPSPRILSGDFSKYVDGNGNVIPIIDPLTGKQFPGNVIPPDRLSSSSLAIEKDIYVNNFGLPFKYIGNPDSNLNNAVTESGSFGTQTSWVAKVDQNIGTKHVLSVDYSNLRAPIYNSGFCAGCYTGARELRAGTWETDNWPQDRGTVAYTYTPTPRVVNQLRLGFTRYSCAGGPVNSYSDLTPMSGKAMLAKWGIQGITPTDLTGYPTITIDSWFNSVYNAGHGVFDTRYQAYDNLTYVQGRHSIKGGVSYIKTLEDSIYNPGFGNFDFTGQFTGEPFADFLLGIPGTFGRSQARPDEARRISELALYLQDSWRVTHKLELSYGLRWDHYTAPYDKNGMYYVFDPNSGSIVVPNQFALDHISPLWPTSTLPVVVASSAGYPSRLTNPSSRWLPRFGFAYRPTNSDNFVIRGGFGVYNAVFQFGGLQMTGPFTLSEGYTNNLVNGAPQYAFPNAFPGAAGSVSGVATGSSVSPNFRPDYMMTWNLTVEKQLFPNWGLRVSYMGNKDTQMALRYNMNTPVLSSQPFDQSRRPYPAYQNITRIENGANSHYNALQILVHHPFRNGLLLQASYTVQRAYDNVGGGGEGQQWARAGEPTATLDYAWNRARDYARSRQWPTQDITVNYSYQPPFGTNQRFLSNTSGSPAKWFLARIVGNWTANGYVVWHTGQFFTPLFSGYDPGGIDQFTGRPDVVPGCNLYTGLPYSNTTPYFNTACFKAPAPGTLGNAPLNMLAGPSMWVASLSPYKTFHIPHWERGSVTVGAQIYNIFNNGAYWGTANGNYGSYHMNPDGSFSFTSNPNGTALFPWYIRRDSEEAFQRHFIFMASFQF